MAATKPVWGIDLGQCALKAIRLRAAGDKVEVLDHVYIEHGKILSQPDVDRVALVAESMKKLVEMRPEFPKESIVAAVPGQHTLARFIKLPPVEKASKLPELVRFEAGQQIPFGMDEVIWDYQIFPSQAAETEVGIFAMRRELMRDHLRFLSDLNIEPMLVQAAPLALYNALQFDGLCGGGEAVAILDIGAQNTDLLVVEGDSLWTRNIPIGGNNFTDAMLDLQAVVPQGRGSEAQSRQPQVRPADLPGHAAGVRRPGGRSPAIDRLLHLVASRREAVQADRDG